MKGNIFQQVKAKYDQKKKGYSEDWNKARASELAKLKTKREYYEGKARLAEKVQKEEERIKKAQKTYSKHKAEKSFVGKVGKAVKKFDDVAQRFGRPPGGGGNW